MTARLDEPIRIDHRDAWSRVAPGTDLGRGVIRQSARHRRHGPPYLRVGASILIPALVATGTYQLLNDSPDVRTTTTRDSDMYTPPSVFTGIPTTDTTTPTSDPSKSPTDGPTTNVTDSAEPTDELSSTTGEPGVPSDDPTSTEPDPTASDDPTTDPPPSTPDDDHSDKRKPTDESSVNLNSNEADMLAEINDERADAGCPAVNPNASLMEAAAAHSADMAAERDESTEGSDGSSPQQRAYRAGYSGTVAEVAFEGIGYAPVAFLFNLSSDEKEIVADCRYKSIGVGSTRRGLTYWTLDFGTS